MEALGLKLKEGWPRATENYKGSKTLNAIWMKKERWATRDFYGREQWRESQFLHTLTINRPYGLITSLLHCTFRESALHNIFLQTSSGTVNAVIKDCFQIAGRHWATY